MELIDKIVADKAAGTRSLVAEYGTRLHETAFRLCGNAADAEDYTFRTLERAVARIHLFSAKSSLFTWLYEIMVNLIRTDARRKAANALVFQEKLPDFEDERPDAGDALSAQEEAIVVRKAIDELPAENAGGFAALRPIAFADEPVKGLSGEKGLMILNGKAMVVADLWRNGTAAAAYWLWESCAF